ncbi:GAF domain-containing sensor histidine kinase [Chondromyces apiculatus]|nr:GAF domain-containing sensor histidine kinase [Chondromyces apiculatus]
MADDRDIQDRIALLSVLHELTVAALDLFDPRRPVTGFLERTAERLGCPAALLLDESAPAPRLLGAVGLSAFSCSMTLTPGAPLPFPELSRPGLVSWRLALSDTHAHAGHGEPAQGGVNGQTSGEIDPDYDPPSRPTPLVTLLLFFDGEPQFGPQYRGMMRRLVSILHTALVHRRLYAHTLRNERERTLRLEQERQARAEAEDEQRRAAFLAEASRRLSTSLNYEATLTRVARLPVPFMASFCMVDVLEGKDTLRRAVVVHADPARSQVARRLERTATVEAVTLGPITEVLRTSEPLRWDLAELDASATSEETNILAQLDVTRLVSVPLVSRGTTLGVMTFGCVEDNLCYALDDVSLVEELGRRAALAIDNARLYDSAQRAIRAREDMVAVVSHDLKNPLATMFINLQVLSRKLPPDDQASSLRAPIERIQRAAERMERLIRDLLDLARLDAGHLLIEPVMKNPGSLLSDALDMVRESAAQKSVHLEASAADTLPLVRCDHERVLQVLSNLAGNAVKFTPPGGQVEMSAAQEGGEVVFAVRDTGPGIPDEQRSSLFNRYWQAKETAHQGTGLGLSIAKGLVELQGGRIWVESAPGSGSTFFFTLPSVPSTTSVNDTSNKNEANVDGGASSASSASSAGDVGHAASQMAASGDASTGEVSSDVTSSPG